MDKLSDGDVITVDMINETVNKLKDFRIKPVDVDGKKYYFWIQGEDGEWIPSDDPRARDALVAQIGEWDHDKSKS